MLLRQFPSPASNALLWWLQALAKPDDAVSGATGPGAEARGGHSSARGRLSSIAYVIKNALVLHRASNVPRCLALALPCSRPH